MRYLWDISRCEYFLYCFKGALPRAAELIAMCG